MRINMSQWGPLGRWDEWESDDMMNLKGNKFCGCRLDGTVLGWVQWWAFIVLMSNSECPEYLNINYLGCITCCAVGWEGGLLN